MCGVAGALTLQAERGLPALMGRMTAAIAHRGPDDAGEWCDGAAGIGLGHRRLSILDLSYEGHQPKHSRSGRWVIAFNGEIYNFRALRQQLEDAGGAFRGGSDTEVLLAGFDAWGFRPTVERAVGMFAIAAWDRAERTLYLARDRFGEKPLYVARFGRTMLFGSELKALAAHPAWRGEIDRDALAAYMRLGYVPSPRSIFRGVRKMRPGTIVAVRAVGDDFIEIEESYWSIAGAFEHGARELSTISESEAIDELDRVLRRAVAEQMVSDVPLGAFLSGGVDSSTIVALMQAESPVPVRTFTIGFDERAYDEAVYARNVARHLGTAHTELYVGPEELIDAIPVMPTVYDEPFADDSQVPTYLLSKLARQQVVVSLSGDGGDELFAGYHRYHVARGAWSAIRRVPRAVRAATATSVRAIAPARWDTLADAVFRYVPARYRLLGGAGNRAHKLASLLPSRNAEDLYRRLTSIGVDPSAIVVGGVEPPGTPFASTAAGDELVLQMMQADMGSYLPDDVLVKVDRAAMAVSLETRAPFLDHRVAEHVLRIPMALKLRGRSGKHILKQLLYRLVPRDLIERPKMGFSVPLDQWLRGPLREWAGDLLAPATLARQGYLDPRRVERILREHLTGRANHQTQLWGILMFQAWLRDGLGRGC